MEWLKRLRGVVGVEEERHDLKRLEGKAFEQFPDKYLRELQLITNSIKREGLKAHLNSWAVCLELFEKLLNQEIKGKRTEERLGELYRAAENYNRKRKVVKELQEAHSQLCGSVHLAKKWSESSSISKKALLEKVLSFLKEAEERAEAGMKAERELSRLKSSHLLRS